MAVPSIAVYHAQNNLGKLSGETGAESYYLGSGVPVSLKPFFEEIGLHLSNQYLLTFAGSDGPKGKYERAKVKTELPGVEFFALDASLFAAVKVIDDLRN